MWPLLDAVSQPDIPIKDKIMYITLVSHVHNLQLDDEADVNFVKEKIEELFASHLSRYEGLLFMDALLKNHPTVYFHSWGRLITPCLKCPDSYISQELSLRILNHIIRNFAADKTREDSFRRFIPDIIPLLLSADQNNKAFYFYCESLALCMNKLPKIVSDFLVQVLEFLLKHVDVFSTKIAVVIADCFVALPLCAAYKEKGATAETFLNRWLNFFENTLVTLQAILNDILHFNDADPTFVQIDQSKLFKIEFDNEQNEISYVLSRARVFSSLCRCLAKMISKETCFVQTPVKAVLQCVGRIFLLKENIKLVKEIRKYEAFALCYPIMQNSAFIILEALILNYTIIEQSGNFARLMKESIEVSNLSLFPSATSRQVRSSTWKVINIWLKQYGAKGSYDIVNDDYIIHELLKDLQCENPVSNQSNNNFNEEFEPDEKVECCLDAIKVLKNIFLSSGSYLEAEMTKVISSMILKTVQILQSHENILKPLPSPYSNETCRKKIYDLLLASCLQGEHLQVKHNMQAINAFTIALRDPSLEVSRVCHKAFKLCRYFINPKKPPPESFIYSTIRREIPAAPSSSEENFRTAFDDSSWNLSNGSSQSERVMDLPPLSQTETAFHTTTSNEGQNNIDFLPAHATSSPNHYPEPILDTECNEDGNRLVADKPPSHSNVGRESEEDDDDRVFCVEDAAPPTLTIDIPQTTTPQISHSNSLEPQPLIPESKIVELRPLEPLIPDLEKERDVKYNDTDGHMNCSEEGEVEEETSASSPKRISENGMDESEEESSGEEESEMDDEDEASECHSPENTPEQAIKRRKMNKEDHSEEECEEDRSGQLVEMDNEREESEEDDNEVPNRSPTIREMCRDFVFAEPEEIS